MKHIIKILILSLLFHSCEEHENVVFDNVNGQSFAYFKKNSIDLPIALNSIGSTEIIFGVTTISTQERTINFSIDTDNTDAPSTMYSLSSNTAIIPANSYNASVMINGVYDSLLENENRTVTLIIDSIDGGLVESDKKIKINLFQFCPVPETFFTGMYLIEQTSAYVDGPTLNDGAIVEVTADGTTRSFSTQNYPNYCGNYMDFKFKLLCNQILIDNQNSQCSCGDGTDWFGNPTVNSTYSIDDSDTVMFVTFADDVQANCGAVTDTTYKFTKQ